jgi:PKD repeat protein
MAESRRLDPSMSEPGDELTPLPEQPPARAAKLTRSPYVALGVAAVVVSTVFATVASLASTRDDEAPNPESRGSVESTTFDEDTDTTYPTTTSSSQPGRSSAPPSSAPGSSTTTTSEEEDETTTSDGADPTTPGRPRPTNPRPTTPKPPPPTTQPNQRPVAKFTFSCTELSCSFDGSGSTDDSRIVSYAWSFGDGSTGSGASTSHAYGAGGTYTVTLIVTDDDGASSSTSQDVTVTPPTTTSGN